ncbi:flagellar hook-basal body complex protein [Serpentinicella sp. ANB-PHB4]|uniref:flagellar hook-basal body complex protein n=1 Tax=Serpentinicella sp. ANB-PHB4 TaxID=3074076 RepID=UPI002863B0B7|nr:flagellar hook-basal body complex protein [Serpentinicella sp. ANB-PHB4]MDR5659702.1 flagellar hook-basal body complex protein [Serpentinicella sp. ANB-PHB4]
MFRGLYTATSAMQTSQKKLDITSNNMSNMNTTGFKKDVVVTEAFPEVFLHKLNGDIRTNRLNNQLEVNVTRSGQEVYLSAEGGFFASETINGTSYNRSTAFTVDEEGFLRTFLRDANGLPDTTAGNYILNRQGDRVFVGDGEFDITPQGQVVSNGETVANLMSNAPRTAIGTMNSGVRLDRIHTNFNQGTMEETTNPLDFAIEGRGFFAVETPQGTMFTRDGSFTLNSNGDIIDSEGNFLLGEQGIINTNGNDFILGDNGEIIVDGEVINTVQIFNIANLQDLRKHGMGMYYVNEGVEIEVLPFEGRVVQGFLEGSNINTIEEMVEMISILRLYESNQKVIQAYDDILQKAVNDIGRL